MKALYWFRNDLRVHDNEALFKASKAEELTCVYVIDKDWFKEGEFGFSRMGEHKYQFLKEGLEELQRKIKSLGSQLTIKVGNPVKEVVKLCQHVNANHLFYHKQMGFYESEEEKILKETLTDITHKKYFGQTLFHVNDIPYEWNKIPKVFTGFRKQVEKKATVRNVFPTLEKLPSSPIKEESKIPSFDNIKQTNADPELGQRVNSTKNYGGLTFKGGEQAGLDRLQHYFWETEQLKNYKFSRNGLLGMDYSSKFSPWLAWGFLSPRTIYWEVQKFEKQVKKNVSTYWLIFELIWRDFFAFTVQMHGKKPFIKGGIKQLKADWEFHEDRFWKWANGETGIPFVDANMRELNATGFMGNRGRQNVASFLAQDLNIDWRAGAYYFEQQLIDYDVCSNWGNWNYVSGVGNDPRDRWFNVILQAQRYDEKAEYIKTWLPELEQLAAKHTIMPWTALPEVLTFANVSLGGNYPFPIVKDKRWKTQ